MGHTDDPVPLLIAGPGVTRDGSLRFTESYAAKGKLGTLKHAYEILPILTRPEVGYRSKNQ
jgi:2,3-bisphosphoglycerate-independent phosphoglycerate mutase